MQCFFPPGPEFWLGHGVLHHRGLTGADRSSRRSLTVLAVVPFHLQALQITVIMSPVRHRLDNLFRRLARKAHPGQSIAADFDEDAADDFQQLLLFGIPGDHLVAFAENRERAVGPTQGILRTLDGAFPSTHQQIEQLR